MKHFSGHKALFTRRLTAYLLAGMILAACSACGVEPPVSSIPVQSGAVLPSIGVPEGGDLIPADSQSPESTAAEIPSTDETGPSGEIPDTTEAPTEATEPPTQPTQPPAPKAEIRALTPEQLSDIRAKYDGTVSGFGTGFRHNWVDADNRPTMVNNLLARFAGTDAKLMAYCSDAGSKCVAFSFQCGTEYGHTGAVLDILKKYGVPATFYIIHSYAEHNRALVERMIGEGHDVGSHTYSCPSGGIANWSLEAQMEDALKMQRYMQDSFGFTMSKFNFNSGYWSEQAIIMMSRMGYQVDFCSCNYSDYDPNAVFDAPQLISDLEACLHPGCIYCFHTTNVITPTILEPLIQYCVAQGYRIVAVP